MRRTYKGMNFLEWCKLDKKDERKINYTLKYITQDKTEQFTSDDILSGDYLIRLQNSTIESIKLIDNEWYAVLLY